MSYSKALHEESGSATKDTKVMKPYSKKPLISQRLSSFAAGILLGSQNEHAVPIRIWLIQLVKLHPLDVQQTDGVVR